ncbi:anti-sigma factor family protein [Actinokineospora sp. G85]|uniref:anti-sigma factor family protein n=1 Tax=Actinokineospora sp. G85 TaxID=3406626 RepID=UPI003C70BC62
MTFESWGLSDQHLMPDAVVAFVDGELGRAPYDRVTAHLARCPWCAAEVSAQRQARSEVRAADVPTMSPGLLAALRAIPQEVDLPSTPDNLAVTADGQLVAVQRPEVFGAGKQAFGAAAPLGSGPKLGEGKSVLGGRRTGRRAAQGAGVVVSGLVLGALALVNTGPAPVSEQQLPRPAQEDFEPVGFTGGATSTPSSSPLPTTSTPVPVPVTALVR